jgi:hypothetical protein
MPREITRRRTRDDEDAQEERRPIRRGRSRDEDEDERPARRSSRRDSDDSSGDERPRRAARRSRDEDEDEGSGRRSRGEGRSSGAPMPTNTGRGRASVRKHRETHRSGDFAPKFTVPEKEDVLIKFIDDDFFFTYYEHWIREFQGQRRQMSFVCLGDNCPLCEIGDDPKFTALINVIDLSDPDDPQAKVWYCTPNPAEVVEELMDDAKSSPVNDKDKYFAVSKKQQKNKFTSYKAVLVKARDLEEDWDTKPLSSGEIDDLAAQAYTEDDCVRITPKRDMQDVADELS